MFKIITAILGISLTLGVGGSIYNAVQNAATSAKHAYQFNQLSYTKFTKAMTDAKARRPHQ